MYETALRTPMLALIDAINNGQPNHSLAAFAPDHIRPPHKAMMRIYRDTRFDASRGTTPRPYKTQIAAWWSRSGMEKTSGAGFYFHLSAKELVIAAGCYMPPPDQLLAIRRYLLEHHAELRALLASKKLRAVLGELEGHRLTRPPRGFDPKSPQVAAALDLIICRQWGVSATLPAEAATQPTLLKAIVTRFALAAPMVDFLNTAILSDSADSDPAAPKKSKKIALF